MDMLRVERKRGTIMNVDVAGYSHMMAHNAFATIEAVMSCMQLIGKLVRACGGCVLDSVGDNLAAEFEHEATALRCALDVQRALARRNRDVPAAQFIRIRIGLHAGELFAASGRVFGDTVNIAARLQAAAEPEGILISEAVAERLDRALGGTLTACGPRLFKNIPAAMSTFSVDVGI